MGNIIGNLAHTGHQTFDLGQHRVKVVSQLVKFITITGNRHAPGQVTRHNAFAGVIDGIDSGKDIAAHQQTTGNAEQHHQSQRPEQSAANDRNKGLLFFDIATNDKVELPS